MFKLAVVAIALVAVSAIPLKPDDMPERIRQAEIDSNANLKEFVEAWKNDDKDTVYDMLGFIINIAESGYDHSLELNSKFDKLKPILVKLSRSPFSLPMKTVAALIDGNRDNKSYYDLETVIQWITKRQEAGVEDADLAQALAAAKESQDALQAMADAFVNVIKAIRVDSTNMAYLMRDAVEIMDAKATPFLEKFYEAINALKVVQIRANGFDI